MRIFDCLCQPAFNSVPQYAALNIRTFCLDCTERPVTLMADELASKSKNTPFSRPDPGGRAVLTLVKGRCMFDLDGRNG